MLNNLSEKEKQIYETCMLQIKRNNADYLMVRKSKEYRLGLMLSTIKKLLKSGKFKMLKKEAAMRRMEKKVARRKFKKPDMQTSVRKPDYFSDERIAIYTCVFGKYDKIIEPDVFPDNCDYYIITDNDVPETSSWKKMNIDSLQDTIKNMTNAEKNRYFKILPHKVFSDYKYSIYIDGNIQVISDLTEYIHYLGKTGVGFHLHPGRCCVYEEAQAVLIYKKETKENIKKHIEHLEAEKMPRYYGMCECNVIVREHHNPVCKKLMSEWWEEYITYAKRDQLSLPYVLYKNQIPVFEVAVLGNNVKLNPSFRVIRHI